MKHVKILSLLAFAGCTQSIELPSPTPPPPWGVPITGGTMMITHDGKAIVADPDRDRILSVDLGTNAVTELALTAGDEPGRIAEDAAGRIHVALRRGGALVTIVNGKIESRRAVCAEPRGLAYDATSDLVHVACTTGELVSFPAAGGDAVRQLRLDRDLRDVAVSGNQLIVTRFRTAEVLTLDAQGAIVTRVVPPTVHRFNGGFGGPGQGGVGSGSGVPGGPIEAIPAVAWRAIPLANGKLMVAHQRQLKGTLGTQQGGYGQGCGQGPVEDAVTLFAPGQAPFAVAPPARGALAVDIAVNSQGTQFAFAIAGTKQVEVVSTASMGTHDDDQCGGDNGNDRQTFDDGLGAPTSVAFRANGDLVTFYPEYPALVVRSATETHTITLPGEMGYDSGRAMFHTSTGVGLACASCHPEGRDDGLVWQFDNIGLRRTQNLSGGILGRAPYHWTGDMTTLTVLMDNVFGVRMAGGTPTHSEHVSLGPWLDRLQAPAPAPIKDADAVARGSALFESADTMCTTCHRGALYTNSKLVDVGTGGTFKVPSLVGVAARPPFMHNGCAATLRDRFGACGGGDTHGHTSQLTPAQVDDLVAFLETL
ncbi:MAG: cytochrome peroxidase [Myxococcales bacterium]|nr:cytochrome peroxidase [Myxococcales bacterium]